MESKGFSFYMFAVLAWMMTGCIVAQTLFAGLAIFTDPSYWRTHVVFVHIFEYLPILMLILSFTARLDHKLKWQCAALFGLIIVQYFTANVPWAGAVHPVMALVMFWLSFRIAKEVTPIRNVSGQGREGKMEWKPMNWFALVLLSLFGGLIFGFLLSQIVGILGHFVFGFPTWVKWVRYLPFLTGILCAVAVPLLYAKKRSGN